MTRASGSFRSMYRHQVQRHLARLPDSAPVVTDTDLDAFDAQGDLVNFISGDRYYSRDGRTGEKRPWSTPARGHRDFNGLRLPTRGDATWKTPQGDFVYGEFNLETVEYVPAAVTPAEAGPA